MSKTDLQPRNSLVSVVEIKSRETKTDKGVIVPGSQANDNKLCEVVEVGPGYNGLGDRSSTFDLKPGQFVLVKMKQGGQTLGFQYKDDQERDLLLVDETQVLAIVGGRTDSETD